MGLAVEDHPTTAPDQQPGAGPGAEAWAVPVELDPERRILRGDAKALTKRPAARHADDVPAAPLGRGSSQARCLKNFDDGQRRGWFGS